MRNFTEELTVYPFIALLTAICGMIVFNYFKLGAEDASNEQCEASSLADEESIALIKPLHSISA